MEKIKKIIVVLFLINVIVFNFTFADTSHDGKNFENEDVQQESENISEENSSQSSTPIEIQGTTVNTENLEEGLVEIADKGENLAYKIVEQISDKSLPICAILILWGAVLYFILGIRNLYKKRQGLLLMWGAFTFVVIAKIMNFAFWFAFMR